jgi:hypothetical protein
MGGQGGSTAMHSSSTPPKRMSVGVKKALVAFKPCGVDKPAPSVMATNSKPISVAPADAPTMKKFSQPSKSTHCGHSKIYVLDSEFRWVHDRPEPIGDRSWTSGIGCAASVSANTRPYFARMTSTSRF